MYMYMHSFSHTSIISELFLIVSYIFQILAHFLQYRILQMKQMYFINNIDFLFYHIVELYQLVK